MRIDFHIHAFPDALAERAIRELMDTVRNLDYDTSGMPYADGTEAGAREKLSQYADLGVLMPIATRIGQQKNVNDWAKNACHGNITSFGSVFPFDPEAEGELERIKAMGLKGVKLHPDYQHFDVSDERAFPIYKKACELGLPVLFHAGLDPVSIDRIHCRPAAIRTVAERFEGLTVIAAHMGGSCLYEEAKRDLYPKRPDNLYIDCSMNGFFATREQLLEGIELMGAKRVLFATDLPWSDGVEAVKRLDSIGLSKGELELIYHKNAERILGLTEEV